MTKRSNQSCAGPPPNSHSLPRQALTQAFQDVFFLIAALFAAALVVVPFCKTVILSDNPPVEAH